MFHVLHLYVASNVSQTLFFQSSKEDKSLNTCLRYKGASLSCAIKCDIVISPNFGGGSFTNRSFPGSAVGVALKGGAFALCPALCSAWNHSAHAWTLMCCTTSYDRHEYFPHVEGRQVFPLLPTCPLVSSIYIPWRVPGRAWIIVGSGFVLQEYKLFGWLMHREIICPGLVLP